IQSPWRRPAAAVLAAISLLTIAALAYASIPDSSGVIHGCRGSRSGVLRVIDSDAGARCLAGEVALDWNQQGEPGPPGPPGVGQPRAYAQVGYFGTLIDSRSQNVTDVQLVEGGVYCIAVPFTPVNVQVTLGFGPAIGVQATIHSYGGCPPGYEIAVLPVNANDVQSQSEFWIAIY